jgi:molybdate transport system regulatory protein
MLDMSYRRAWLLVDDLNKMFETPLVETSAGGKGGLNAKLSILGRAVLQLYRAIENETHSAAAAHLDELARHLAPQSATKLVKPKRAGKA